MIKLFLPVVNILCDEFFLIERQEERSGGRPLALKYGRFVLIDHADIDKADRFFAKYGDWAVLIGRLLPVIRTFIAFPAGVAPEKPADRNCKDFATWQEAKQFFDTYYPYYGDVAKLDGNHDGIPCNALPGAP